MVYKGVKFETRLKKGIFLEDIRLNFLMYWCNMFYENNIAPSYGSGSYGNLSFRLNNGDNKFIITASGEDLGSCSKKKSFTLVSNVDLEKCIVYAKGLKKPSSESMVHYAIYNERPNINAIFHGHCNEISKNAIKLGVVITAKEQPYGTMDLVREVLDVLDKNNFLEMKNHGFLSLGNTMKESGSLALKYYIDALKLLS